jgi:hypothetical protein
VGPRDVDDGHEGEGDLLAQLAQGGFAGLTVGVSAEGSPEADRQALCSPSSAATESSGAVELGEYCYSGQTDGLFRVIPYRSKGGF